MLAVDEIAILEPRRLHREGLRRIERTVGLEREIGGDHGQPHALRTQWAVRLAVSGDGNAGLDRKPVEANLAAGHAVAACFMAQQAQIVGQYAGAFVGTKRAALRLRIADPFAAGLVGPGVTRVGEGDDQRVAVLINTRDLEVHAGLEVSHDDVHACGEGLGLFGAQPVGEVVDLGVAVGLRQRIIGVQGTGSGHGRVGEVGKGLQVTAALRRVIGAFGQLRVHVSHANRVQHAHIFGHGIDDRMWVFRAAEGNGRGGLEIIQPGGLIDPA